MIEKYLRSLRSNLTNSEGKNHKDLMSKITTKSSTYNIVELKCTSKNQTISMQNDLRKLGNKWVGDLDFHSRYKEKCASCRNGLLQMLLQEQENMIRNDEMLAQFKVKFRLTDNDSITQTVIMVRTCETDGTRKDSKRNGNKDQQIRQKTQVDLEECC